MSKLRINWAAVKKDIEDSATIFLAVIIITEAGALVGSPVIYVWKPLPPSLNDLFKSWLLIGIFAGWMTLLLSILLGLRLKGRYTYYENEKGKEESKA